MSPKAERNPLAREAHLESTRSEKRAYLSKFVVKGGVGAELGVFWGHFSEVIIREFQPRTLYLVDLWDLQGESFDIEGRFTDFGRMRTSECYAHVQQIAARHPGVVHVVKEDASAFLSRYEGEPFDWVYIDTSHKYDDTLRELSLIAERLKPGGVILGDDWIADPDHRHYEVVRAVHSFVRATDFEIVEAGRGHQFVLRRGVELERSASAVVPPARASRPLLVEKLQALSARPTCALDVVTGGAATDFSASMGHALAGRLAARGAAITWNDLTNARVPSPADVVLLVGHAQREEATFLGALRASGFGGVAVAWLWDNHHAKERNRRVAELADVTIAAHDCHAGYLASHSLLFRSVAVGSSQWTADEARALWRLVDTAAPRSPRLYGGFGRYKGSDRTAHLERLIASGRYPALYFVDGEKGPGFFDYFKLSSEARFRHWAEHAVSLCLPYRNDLGLRFFDAWLTGQIAIVTPDIRELQSEWATPHRDRNFVEAASYDLADIDAAHARALELFEAGGSDGQHARHRLALEHHLFEHRVERILELLRDAGAHGIEAVLRRSSH
jgi:hypothetical protein